MTLEKIADRLFNANRIAIFTHINPDCDGYGSMFALYEGLKLLGKKASMFVDGQLSKFESQIFETNKIETKDFVPEKYDTLIAVDCADMSRLGKYGVEFYHHENTFKIDHHIQRDNFSKNSYVEHESASCTELIYDLLNKLQVEITPKIATYLYAGIATDTNSFMNTNTTARTYKIAHKLFEKGADTKKINKLCFRSTSKEQIALTKVFYDKMKILDGYFSYVILNKKDFKKTGAKAHFDTQEYSNILCSIGGVKASCSAVEEENGVFSLSFRAIPGVDVEGFARLFGGGGHKEASGARVKLSEKQFEKKLIENAKKYFGKNNA